MRFLISLILCILIQTSNFYGQSKFKDECYLFVRGNVGEKRNVIEQIVKPLISSFVSPTKINPPEGISTLELQSSCFYDVSVTITGDILNLSINGQRTPVSLNGVSNSKHPFPENIRHSTLLVLHKELSNPQKKEICQKYGELLIDVCPQNQRLILVSLKESNRDREKVTKESRANIVSGIESLVGSIDQLDFVGVAEINSDKDLEKSLIQIMSKLGSNSSLVVSTEWDFQEQESSMWKGLVSMVVSIDSYYVSDTGLINRGSFSTAPQRIPIRKWGKSKSFQKKNLLRISKKVISKWSDSELKEFILSINN